MNGRRGFPIQNKDRTFKGQGTRGMKRGTLGFPHIHVADKDTTKDGMQVWVIFGESIAGDTSSSTTLGPTTLPGTCYLSNGTTITELTTADLNNAGPSNGTPWKKFALDYNAATGKKCVFVNAAAGGSEFYPNGDDNNWWTTGNKYGPMITKVKNTLRLLKLNKVAGMIGELGINDMNSSNSMDDIITGFHSLIRRINIDLNTPPIYMVSIGRRTAGFIDARVIAFKREMRNALDKYENFHLPVNLHPFWDWGMYDADETHLNASNTGNNKMGEMCARYLTYEEPNKLVKAIQNSFFSDIGATNRAALKVFVEGCILDGNWDKQTMDWFQWFHSTTIEDKCIDWCLLGSGRRRGTIDGGGTNFYHTDGAAGTSFSTNLVPANAYFASQNDFIMGMRTGNNTVAAGTAGNAMISAATNLLRQTTGSVLQYFAGSASGLSWTAGDTAFVDDTDYSIQRTSSVAAALNKNGATVHSSGANTSAAPDASAVQVGASAAGSFPMDCQWSHFFYAKRSTLDLNALLTRLATLRASWV